MMFKNKLMQLCIALVLGLIVMLLPRPEGTKFEIIGDPEMRIFSEVKEDYVIDDHGGQKTQGYVLRALTPDQSTSSAKMLEAVIGRLGLADARVVYIDGLSPVAKRFLATLVFLLFLFVFEPIPLEITAVCIGVLMILTGRDGCQGRLGPLYASGGGIHHVLPCFCHCHGKSGLDQTSWPGHRAKSR